MPSAKKDRKKSEEKNQNDPKTLQIKAVLMVAAAVFLYAGLQFTEQTGYMGFIVDNILRYLLGEGAVAFPFILALAAFAFLWSHRLNNLRGRLIGLSIIFFLLLVILHLGLLLSELERFEGDSFYSHMIILGQNGRGGGLIGALLTVVLFFFFRDLGSYIVISALGIVAILLITNSTVTELGVALISSWKFLVVTLTAYVKNFTSRLPGKKASLTPADEHHLENETPKFLDFNLDGPEKAPEFEAERENEKGVFPGSNTKSSGNALKEVGISEEVEKQDKEQNGSKEELTGNVDDDLPVISQVVEPQKPHVDYSMPSLNLLTKVGKIRDFQQQKIVQDRAAALEKTFDSFGVKVRIKEVQTGPAITRFEIQPETGVKVSKILSLSDDLALNLAAPDVRIEAPIPGKAAIGIEVPNKVISPVYLRDVLEDPFFEKSSSPLTIGLGKDIAGSPVFADLLKMPHLLIAGSTGSGKSVCINALICSILLKAKPWIVKMLLIDPKQVELSTYNGIPHLISPVVTGAKKASMALQGIVKEMVRRYDLFAHKGVRDIASYNELKENPEELSGEGEGPLPYLVVIIDELADLMMVAPSEVEDSIVRLSQMSRAAGIHLVIATQRPSVDIITGLIKANITSRIAFAVSSQTDSRTILDIGGAEKLLGRGDMLYHPIGINKPLRVQGAFLSEKEIFKIVDYIRQQDSPHYQQSFLTEESVELHSRQQERDNLLEEAVDLIMHTGHASISLIQRRFRVGYTRAARLIDEMEMIGIIGKHEGSKPRQLLMDKEQAASVLKSSPPEEDG